MNDTQNYEKAIKLKTEGKLLLAQIALIAGYILFAIVGILLAILIADGHPALIVLVAALDFAAWLLTKNLVKIEYEYIFVSGSFYLAKIFGRSARREIFESELSKVTTVAPYSGNYKVEADHQSIERKINAISSKKAIDVWFMLFEGENGSKTLILFEADEKSLRLIRQSVPRAVAREKLTLTETRTENE